MQTWDYLLTFELEHVTEVEVPDILSPAGLVFLRLCLEDQHLFLLAQLETCRVSRDVLIQSEVTCLVGGEKREELFNVVKWKGPE